MAYTLPGAAGVVALAGRSLLFASDVARVARWWGGANAIPGDAVSTDTGAFVSELQRMKALAGMNAAFQVLGNQVTPAAALALLDAALGQGMRVGLWFESELPPPSGGLGNWSWDLSGRSGILDAVEGHEALLFVATIDEPFQAGVNNEQLAALYDQHKGAWPAITVFVNYSRAIHRAETSGTYGPDAYYDVGQADWVNVSSLEYRNYGSGPFLDASAMELNHSVSRMVVKRQHDLAGQPYPTLSSTISAFGGSSSYVMPPASVLENMVGLLDSPAYAADLALDGYIFQQWLTRYVSQANGQATLGNNVRGGGGVEDHSAQRLVAARYSGIHQVPGAAFWMAAAVATWGLNGRPALLAGARVLQGAGAALGLPGQSAALVAGRKLGGMPGALGLTGRSAALNYETEGSYLLSAEVGAYLLPAPALGLRARRVMGGAAGSYVMGGQPAGVLVARRLGIAAGTLGMGGLDSQPLFVRQLTGDLALLALSGAASLSSARRLTGEGAGYGIGGLPPVLPVTRRIGASGGQLALDGAPPRVLAGRQLSGAAALLTLAGVPLALYRAKRLGAASASYVVSARDSALIARHMLAGTVGTLSTSGAPSALAWSPLAPPMWRGVISQGERSPIHVRVAPRAAASRADDRTITVVA